MILFLDFCQFNYVKRDYIFISPDRIRTDVHRSKACYPWPLDDGAVFVINITYNIIYILSLQINLIIYINKHINILFLTPKIKLR